MFGINVKFVKLGLSANDHVFGNVNVVKLGLSANDHVFGNVKVVKLGSANCHTCMWQFEGS